MSFIKIGDYKYIRPIAELHPDYWRVQIGHVEYRLANGLTEWDANLPLTVMTSDHPCMQVCDDIVDPGDRPIHVFDESPAAVARRQRRVEMALTRRQARLDRVRLARQLAVMEEILETSRLPELLDSATIDETIGLNTAVLEQLDAVVESDRVCKWFKLFNFM